MDGAAASPASPASTCVPAPQLKPLGLQAQSQNKSKVPFSCTGYKIENFLEPSWGTVYKLETAEKACQPLGKFQKPHRLFSATGPGTRKLPLRATRFGKSVCKKERGDGPSFLQGQGAKLAKAVLVDVAAHMGRALDETNTQVRTQLLALPVFAELFVAGM